MELPSPGRGSRAISLLLLFSLSAAVARAQTAGAEAALRFHLGQEARRQGDEARAVEWLAEAVRLDPGAALPRIEWAAALLVVGDPGTAEAVLAPLAEWWEERPVGEDLLAARYARLRAAAISRRGDADMAVTWYERAVERAPMDIGLRSQLIGHYRVRGDEEAALVHLQAVALAMPFNAELRVELGRTFLSLGRWGEAEVAFGEAVVIDPLLDRAWDGLGVARTNLGDYAGAEEALRRGLRVAPASAAIYEHLGDALLGDGRGEEALAAYRRAAALDPGERRLAEKIDRLRAALP